MLRIQKNEEKYCNAYKGKIQEKILTLLQQDSPGKPIIQIPEIHTANPAFVIQLSINIKGFISGNFKLPHSFTRSCSILNGRIELITPRRSITVAVPVIVTKEIIALGLQAGADLKRLVDGSEKVLCEVRD